MHKFKIGDKVVRASDASNNARFQSVQGVKDYYTVTRISGSGCWLQLDGVVYREDSIPWRAVNFELYQEPDDELPPVPDSVYYPDMYTLLTGLHACGGTSGLTVRQSPYTAEAISLSIDDSKWTRLDADAALQLAHDLRRMAMDIRRKEKASEV